ncbi:hypothetical protein SRHO_G00195930 [Serrasalmus rhombeus]
MEKSVDRKRSIFKLDPVLDRGVLRVGGRLSKMAMPEEQKHPAILPKGHHVSKLLLGHIHQQENCDCVPCRWKYTCAGEQKMADLPIDHLTPDLPPFPYVGGDYFGPIEVRRGRGMVKRSQKLAKGNEEEDHIDLSNTFLTEPVLPASDLPAIEGRKLLESILTHGKVTREDFISAQKKDVGLEKCFQSVCSPDYLEGTAWGVVLLQEYLGGWSPLYLSLPLEGNRRAGGRQTPQKESSSHAVWRGENHVAYKL